MEPSYCTKGYLSWEKFFLLKNWPLKVSLASSKCFFCGITVKTSFWNFYLYLLRFMFPRSCEIWKLIFFLSVNTSHNITESEENYWSRIEKSILAPILTTEMVLGVLGNGLVLIVKLVVRIIYNFVFFSP